MQFSYIKNISLFELESPEGYVAMCQVVCSYVPKCTKLRLMVAYEGLFEIYIASLFKKKNFASRSTFLWEFGQRRVECLVAVVT